MGPQRRAHEPHASRTWRRPPDGDSSSKSTASRVEVPHGATVMDAANKLGIYVPHFCYHKKLSIAANCRMCLVRGGEGAQAAARLRHAGHRRHEGLDPFRRTPRRRRTGVMEFLLINHPLDCPICDQGGECQLQDLAVGYGAQQLALPGREARRAAARSSGPLVAAEEMSRCIQCTRCVRFGQEIAGVMELGLAGRGEHAEIVSFVGQRGRLRALRQHDRPLPGRRAHLEAVPLHARAPGSSRAASRSRRTTRSARTWSCR